MKIFDYQLTKHKGVCAWPPQWAIDVRHAKLLHNLLMHAPIARYAEIGSGGGVSTTAPIEALRNGKNIDVHLCDRTFTPPVLELVEPWIDSGHLHLHQSESVEFLRKMDRLDFVFLDGAHSFRTVRAELTAIKSMNVRYIAAHDTSALERALAYGMPEELFNGPAFLREQVQNLPGWYCLEERRHRPREATVRGFFFATNELPFFMKAQKLFRYWSNVPFSEEYDCRFDPNVVTSSKRIPSLPGR
jgi:hypothetical protein